MTKKELKQLIKECIKEAIAHKYNKDFDIVTLPARWYGYLVNLYDHETDKNDIDFQYRKFPDYKEAEIRDIKRFLHKNGYSYPAAGAKNYRKCVPESGGQSTECYDYTLEKVSHDELPPKPKYNSESNLTGYEHLGLGIGPDTRR